MSKDSDVMGLIYGDGRNTVRQVIEMLTNSIHENARSKGFWDERDPNNVHCRLAMLMLITTEVAEAAEACRKGDFENISEECADIIIRVLDFCGGLNIDIYTAINEKMAKNVNRPRLHGKLA